MSAAPVSNPGLNHPRRRILRIRLATVFFVFTLVTLPLGWIGYQVRRFGIQRQFFTKCRECGVDIQTIAVGDSWLWPRLCGNDAVYAAYLKIAPTPQSRDPQYVARKIEEIDAEIADLRSKLSALGESPASSAEIQYGRRMESLRIRKKDIMDRATEGSTHRVESPQCMPWLREHLSDLVSVEYLEFIEWHARAFPSHESLDQELGRLIASPSLRSVSLYGFGEAITDTAFSGVRSKRIRTIQITGCAIGDEAMASLGPQPRLMNLIVTSSTGLTDQSLRLAANWPSLRALALSNTGITDDGTKHLSQLVELESLSLANTTITGQTLQTLTTLNKLKDLVLSGTALHDEDILLLRQLTNLKRLDLSQCGSVSREAVQRLRSALPTCRIRGP